MHHIADRGARLAATIALLALTTACGGAPTPPPDDAACAAANRYIVHADGASALSAEPTVLDLAEIGARVVCADRVSALDAHREGAVLHADPPVSIPEGDGPTPIDADRLGRQSIAAQEPLEGMLWGLAAIEARRAHAVSTGGGVAIGVIDTGIDCSHGDLAGSCALAHDYIGDGCTFSAQSADASSILPPGKGGDVLLGDPVHLADSRSGESTGNEFGDPDNILVGDLHVGAPWMSAFGDHVAGVGQDGAQEKVVGVDAPRGIARVADVHAIGDGAKVDNPGEAVGVDPNHPTAGGAVRGGSVSSGVAMIGSPYPETAPIWAVYRKPSQSVGWGLANKGGAGAMGGATIGGRHWKLHSGEPLGVGSAARGNSVAHNYSTIAQGATAQQCHFHGTHVAGTAMAVVNAPPFGVVGVAPGARVFDYRVLDSSGSGSLSTIARAIIDFANEHPGGVINMSIGGDTNEPALDAAIRYALDHGVVIVAAAGNSGTNRPSYPGCSNGVIGVGAVSQDGRRADFSNHGQCTATARVDIAAPGVGVVSAVPGDLWARWDGTSMASPHVAGVAALLRSAGTLPHNVEGVLLQHGAPGPGELGGVTVNAWLAVQAAGVVPGPTPTFPPLPTPFPTFDPYPGEDETPTITPVPLTATVATPTRTPIPTTPRPALGTVTRTPTRAATARPTATRAVPGSCEAAGLVRRYSSILRSDYCAPTAR